MLDRLFALALTVLISGFFGAGSRLDSYLLAIAGPSLIAAILGDLVYSLLLPEFVNARTQERGDLERWNMATWALLWLVLITAVYLIAWLVGVSTLAAAAQRPLLVRLGLITAPLILFGGVGALGATLLIAERRYVVATLRIPAASLSAVVLLLILSRVDKGVEVLAFSVVSGALVAALVVVVPVLSVFGRPSVTLSVLSSFRLVRRLGRTSVAQIVAGLVPQAPTPIERLVGFNLGSGVISSLNYGRVLVSPPLLIGQSIATASYPRFVEHKARAEASRYEALGRSIGMVTFLLLPITVVIIGLARSLVELVYHHGAFDERAVTQTTVAAEIIAAAIVPIAVGSVLTRFLYAERASERVAWASVGTLALYALMAVVLGARFSYAGLAVASTSSYALLMFGLLLLVGVASPVGLAFLSAWGLLRTVFASGIAGAAVWLIAGVAGQHAGVLHSLATIAVGGLVGLVMYFVVSTALRSPELIEAMSLGRRVLRLRRV